MNKTAFFISGLVIAFSAGLFVNTIVAKQSNKGTNVLQTQHENQSISAHNMKLGAFSVSLNVKDLNTSKQFYEHLGFTVFAGSMKANYLIMKNENALIGLFQGMFQGNILTFNPGWDENAKNIEKFDDIRAIQKKLKSGGITLTSEADEQTSGPASLTLSDPDGNVILLDQHR